MTVRRCLRATLLPVVVLLLASEPLPAQRQNATSAPVPAWLSWAVFHDSLKS